MCAQVDAPALTSAVSPLSYAPRRELGPWPWWDGGAWWRHAAVRDELAPRLGLLRQLRHELALPTVEVLLRRPELQLWSTAYAPRWRSQGVQGLLDPSQRGRDKRRPPRC
jgi:hypothetical protein